MPDLIKCTTVATFLLATGEAITIGHAKDWTDIDPAGGFRAAAAHKVGFGDTVADAIQAVYDHVMDRPSRRDRLSAPFLTGDREARRWDRCHRTAYDYRSRDFVPPED